VSASRLACRGTWILAAAALIVSHGLAAAPTDVLDACAAGSPHVGIRELDSACPQIEQTLQSLGLDRVLYDGWRQRLSSHGLDDLSNIVRRYSESQRRESPDIAPLAQILQSLKQQQTPAIKSWWDAAKDWLRDWLRHSNSALARWLNEWLEHLDVSGHALDRVIYFLMALIVIAAIVVVAREIRVSSRARRAAQRITAPEPDLQATEVSVRARQLAGVRELLQLLIERLLATGRLAAAGSLTHRELVVLSVFDSDEQRKVFAGIASEAESSLYGPERSAAEDLPDIARGGHALLAQLSDRKEAP
jgi:hypothetical protein